MQEKDVYENAKPILKSHQKIDLQKIRYPGEKIFFSLLILFNSILFYVIAFFVTSRALLDISELFSFTFFAISLLGFYFLFQTYIYWHVFGHSIQITAGVFNGSGMP